MSLSLSFCHVKKKVTMSNFILYICLLRFVSFFRELGVILKSIYHGLDVSLIECELIMGTSLYSKVRSPPYCCAVLLDRRLHGGVGFYQLLVISIYHYYQP